ncbi:hypothetical protein RCL1_008365 [Eukaryota sp. TZLM3-RCL]
MILRHVPKEQRVEYWRNIETEEIVTSEPLQLTPLNPNAYLFVDKHPHGLADHSDIETLKKASRKLLEDVIPELANDLNEEKISPLTSEDLIFEMKKRGIPSRYLGTLANHISHRHHKEMIVVEVVARCVKTLIRDGLSYVKEISQEELKITTLYYLNSALTLQDNQNSLHLWSFIEGLALKKFGIELDSKITRKIHLNSCLFSICKQLGVVLDLSVLEHIDYLDEEPIKFDDVIGIVPVVSNRSIESQEVKRIMTEAKSLDEKGKATHWYHPGGEERVSASDLYLEAAHVSKALYLDETTQEPIDSNCAVELANIFYQIANHFESRHQEKGRPEHSRWNKSAGIQEDDLSKISREYFTEAIKMIDLAMGQNGGSNYASIHVVSRPLHVIRSQCRLGPFIAQLSLEFAYCVHESNTNNEPELTTVSARNARRSYLSLAKIYGEDGSLSLADTRQLTTSGLEFSGKNLLELAYRAVRQFETILASPLSSVPREILAEKIEKFEVDGEESDFEDEF